jgi:hypothetical protein
MITAQGAESCSNIVMTCVNVVELTVEPYPNCFDSSWLAEWRNAYEYANIELFRVHLNTRSRAQSIVVSHLNFV